MMTRRSFALGLVFLGIVPAAAGDREGIEEAIRAAIAATEARVVRLSYFGAGEETLGSAAAPVTGYDAGEGWVLTSTYGLNERPSAILVRRADGEQQEARLVARDESRQLALLRLTNARGEGRPTLVGREARVGETAIALGRVATLERVNTAVGIVSAVDRLGGRAVQTDALTSPLNYGGPLVGLDGSLFGILSPLAPPAMSAGVELYDSGIGFAVPTAVIEERLETLAAGRDLRPGWLGVGLPKDDPLRAGATLVGVTPDGPAANAGLAVGDRLIALAGVPTPTLWTLRSVASGLDAGTTVRVVVERPAGDGGEPTTAEYDVVLGEKPPADRIDKLLDRIKKPDEP